ncbi:MAG: glycosyltransferase family 1 protein, partial [Bacteroidetes bacterium]|nr:glycosyltransferase family 1 protein [Bacteroidota bacterium]
MKEILIDLYKAKNLFSGLGQFSINFAKELVNHSVDDLNFIFLTPKNFEFENINSVNVSFQKRYFPSLNKTYDIWHGLQQFPS